MADYGIERGEGRHISGFIAGLVVLVCLVALAYLWTRPIGMGEPLPRQPISVQQAPAPAPTIIIKPAAVSPANQPVSNAVGAAGDTRPAQVEPAQVLMGPTPANA